MKKPDIVDVVTAKIVVGFFTSAIIGVLAFFIYTVFKYYALLALIGVGALLIAYTVGHIVFKIIFR